MTDEHEEFDDWVGGQYVGHENWAKERIAALEKENAELKAELITENARS